MAARQKGLSYQLAGRLLPENSATRIGAGFFRAAAAAAAALPPSNSRGFTTLGGSRPGLRRIIELQLGGGPATTRPSEASSSCQSAQRGGNDAGKQKEKISGIKWIYSVCYEWIPSSIMNYSFALWWWDLHGWRNFCSSLHSLVVALFCGNPHFVRHKFLKFSEGGHFNLIMGTPWPFSFVLLLWRMWMLFWIIV